MKRLTGRKATENKVFCVGFHKTGTKSFAAALRHLGYRVTGPNWIDRRDIADSALSLALGLVDQYDAFQDNPWPVLYRELHCRFPTAKFILTVRDSQAWIRSVVAHFGKATTPMREWIYGHGSPVGHEAVYVRRYEKHNDEVASYLAAKEAAFLTLRITEGEGWEKICPFLGKPMLRAPFPFENRGKTGNHVGSRAG